MSNPIEKALEELHFTVPRKVLDVAFIKYGQNVNNYQIDLNTIIRQTVIVPRVMKDCNLVGGTMQFIPIAKCKILERDEYKAVIQVPFSATGGRAIVSAIALTEYVTEAGSNIDNLQNQATQLMTPTPTFDFNYTSQIRPMAENTFYIENVADNFPFLSLQCLLENDKNMTNLPVQSYHHFAKLVILAVKAYIYNVCVINMDEGIIQSGANMGILKTVIEGYADANEMYSTYLTETWSKVALMSDQTRHERFIQGSIKHQ